MKWGIIAGVAVVLLMLLIKAHNRAIAYGNIPIPYPQNPQMARPPSGTQLLGQMLSIPGAKYIDKIDATVGRPIGSVTQKAGDAVDKYVFQPAIAPVKSVAKSAWSGIKKIF